MKIESALSEDAKTLYLIIHTEEKLVIDMSLQSATDLTVLLCKLVQEARAQQSFLKLEENQDLPS